MRISVAWRHSPCVRLPHTLRQDQINGKHSLRGLRVLNSYQEQKAGAAPESEREEEEEVKAVSDASPTSWRANQLQHIAGGCHACKDGRANGHGESLRFCVALGL